MARRDHKNDRRRITAPERAEAFIVAQGARTPVARVRAGLVRLLFLHVRAAQDRRRRRAK